MKPQELVAVIDFIEDYGIIANSLEDCLDRWTQLTEVIQEFYSCEISRILVEREARLQHKNLLSVEHLNLIDSYDVLISKEKVRLKEIMKIDVDNQQLFERILPQI